MGMYLNLGNAGFRSVRKGLYVDKSGLISFVNRALGTKDKLICVSRPRRFGKSFATQMLCAYYDRSCRSESLFQDLKIARDEDYRRYMNRYDVLYLDITWFISTVDNIRNTVSYMQEQIVGELCAAYPLGEMSVSCTSEDGMLRAAQPDALKPGVSLPVVLSRIAEEYGRKFIVIIDEWDALFREAGEETALQREYIQLLRGLFKSSQTDKMVEAAYMTGILPIKKYGTQSALTDFREYTMLQPRMLAEYTGFTEEEAEALCREHGLEFEEARKWYDGYSFKEEKSVYSPNSMINAVKSGEFGDYWTESETYESLKKYIGMNRDGLKDTIVSMLAGMRCKVNTRTFQNDFTNLRTKDDVLTLLIHLGYLAYDAGRKEVYIPNQEVADEFRNAVEYSGWEGISDALRESEALLEATIRGDGETVARKLDEVHLANTSVLAYHNELSLSCVVTLAYYVARKDYTLVRELPSGKGFADIAFVPRRYTETPAMIVELKWDKSAGSAIDQIRERRYAGALEEYLENLLLVGISYDRDSKRHSCVIERYET